jgi:LysM repeat protein
MRFRSGSVRASALALCLMSLFLAGCGAGSPDNTVSTASLAPVRDEPRYAGSRDTGTPYALPPRQVDRSYASTRHYTDPGSPTPREYAAYDSGHAYGNGHSIQTGSVGATNRGPYAYEPDARWRQPTNTPLRQTSNGPLSPNVVEVREGDTLFGLSRRYNVPVGDIVAANRLSNERIAIGQRLVIPTRYR